MKSELLINVDRMRGRLTTFETLVAPQIPDMHLPDNALNYEADTRFILDILSHANAFKVGKFFSEKIAKGGKLSFSSLDEVFGSSTEAKNAIHRGLHYLFSTDPDETQQAGEIIFNTTPSSSSTSSTGNPSGGSS